MAEQREDDGSKGTKAQRVSHEGFIQTLEQYHRIVDEVAQLESAEWSLWLTLHPNDELDGKALFGELETKALSQGATEEVKRQHKLLQGLREKRKILASSRDYVSQEHGPQTKKLPLPLSRTKSRVDGARFWAVIVGINHYDNLSNLKGASTDAMAVFQYLTRTLSVPPTQIRLLISETPSLRTARFDRPTRENILSSLFNHLRDNPAVREGDNILIYYAGRGARYSLEDTFPDAEDTLDALCPADRGSSTVDGPIFDISDRELSIFLEELRDVKGSNVTVILDCSYFVETVQDRAVDVRQGTRSAAPLNVSVERMLRAVDGDTRRRAGSKKAFSPDWDWDERACMLLTACLLHEVARETKPDPEARWHGCFTRALVDLLRLNEDRTYAALCEAVTEYMPRFGERCVQNPMAIGAKEGELVWYVRKEQPSSDPAPIEPSPAQPSRSRLALLPCCHIF